MLRAKAWPISTSSSCSSRTRARVASSRSTPARRKSRRVRSTQCRVAGSASVRSTAASASYTPRSRAMSVPTFCSSCSAASAAARIAASGWVLATRWHSPPRSLRAAVASSYSSSSPSPRSRPVRTWSMPARTDAIVSAQTRVSSCGVEVASRAASNCGWSDMSGDATRVGGTGSRRCVATPAARSSGSPQPSLRRSRRTANLTRLGAMPVGSSHAWASSSLRRSTAPGRRTRACSSRNSVGVRCTGAPWTVTWCCTGSTRNTPSSYGSVSSGVASRGGGGWRRSSPSTRETRSVSWKGLARYSSAPPRRSGSSGRSWAVSMITGTSVRSRSRSSTAHPSSSGRLTSSTTRSGRRSYARRNAVRPSAAWITS